MGAVDNEFAEFPPDWFRRRGDGSLTLNRAGRPVLSELGITMVMHVKNCHVETKHKAHVHDPLAEVLVDKMTWERRKVWPQNKASEQMAYYPVTL